MMYQTDPPRPPQDYLPTMYDLPSEDAEEAGLPDEFHLFQPRLLSETFQPPEYAADLVFTGSDLNLYYDVRHTSWYKRPDWFGVVGVSRFYQQRDLRMSYVIWQEGVSPLVVVELLSPGTEREDLGQTLRDVDQPPPKWEVYERLLRVPYYIVFDRATNSPRFFHLQGWHYAEVTDLPQPRFWMPDLQLGIGLWEGTYQGLDRQWLRWYDRAGDWILTPVEQENRQVAQERRRAEQEHQRAEQEHQRAEQEHQRAEQERQRSERLIAQLRSLGVEPDLDT